ncbi:unnamed protein product [Camellia sinensis]
MILQQFSSSYLTEVLHIQQDIARLKEDSAHFQATLTSYKEDTVKLEKELHRKSLDVSLGGTILCQVFAPPPNGFDVDVLRILLELLLESSTPTPTPTIMASTLGREFRNTFHHQVFTEYQRAVFAYKRSSYACRVVEISLDESEGSESLRSTKQGMIRKRTKVIVEVPQSLLLNLKHVRGMLLYGPPGSGKTLIAQNICKLLNAKEPLIINGPDVLNAFQGVSESKIRSLFKPAIKDENKYGAKSDLHIIIFDEIDWIVK